MNGTFDDRVLGNLDARCGPSLTTVRRCGTVAGKECSSSEHSGNRTRQSRGFFVPGSMTMAGRATDKKPRKGEEVHRLCTATNLLATRRGRAVATSPRFFTSHRSRHMSVPSVIPFSFENHPVRVLIINGEPWFVAKDLCAVLHIVNSRSALIALDETEKGVGSTDTLGGQQELAIVNESGMWTLVLRCRDAVKSGTVPYRVRKWITGEVLPSIRKTGEYTVNPDLEYDQMRSYSKDRKQMEALNTAHSRWISDVRRVLESAGIKEPE
ncbi:BRO-N domain-containing protein, partial [Xylella fastidiosa]|uniref:BRO-N domain-containing protein n=1 Tax=Xylella fastidiosa TaxID=2371 RepID=UPI002351B77E